MKDKAEWKWQAKKLLFFEIFWQGCWMNVQKNEEKYDEGWNSESDRKILLKEKMQGKWERVDVTTWKTEMKVTMSVVKMAVEKLKLEWDERERERDLKGWQQQNLEGKERGVAEGKGERETKVKLTASSSPI